MNAVLDEVQGTLRQDVFKTILKLGVLGAVLLAMPGLPSSFQPSHSQSYPPAPTRPLPAWTETPRSYQPQPEPTRPPSPYPSRPTPASSYPPTGTTWPAIQLGAIVIAALGIAGAAVGVRFYRRRVW